MQKIHRRKNEDIPKDFVCAEGCGKAYGSYSALYTHMKNKHGYMKSNSNELKTPQVKVKAPTGRKGRPLTKAKEELVPEGAIVSEGACKLCYEQECVCDWSMGSSQLNRTLGVLSDKMYLKLLNCVGNLNVGQNFTWIRSTEEEYQVLSREKLKQLAQEFNLKNNLSAEIRLSDRWLEYLCQLSKCLDPRLQNELMEGIFWILSQKNPEKVHEVTQNEELVNLKRSSAKKEKQWRQFVQTVLMI